MRLILICLIMGLICPVRVECAEVRVQMGVIAHIESGGDEGAYNERSGASGKYQVTLPCLRDYNKAHILKGYSMKDMFDGGKCLIVADWYVNVRIPKYLKYYNIDDTISNRLICYNWGIGNMWRWVERGSVWAELPLETRDYINKYNKLVN